MIDISNLPEVVGERVEGTLLDLDRRARRMIACEQEELCPDNALVAILCNTVRLIREHVLLVKERVASTNKQARLAELRWALERWKHHSSHSLVCCSQLHNDIQTRIKEIEDAQ